MDAAAAGMMRFGAVGTIGAGAWGCALAQVAATAGPVTLWARDPATAAVITATRQAPRLPTVTLGPGIVATADLADLAACDVLLVAVPAAATAIIHGLAGQRPRPLVLCAKGLGPGGVALADVVASLLPDWPVALLSGPTFAAEVGRGLPAAAVVACRDAGLAAGLAARLGSPALRLYTSTDLVGVALGGAVKNVLAIAAGVVAGHGLGDNARAAVITRGFAEMTRFGVALGADPATLAGLSGLGDLVLTCTGEASRNFRFGVALGRGVTPAAATAASAGVAEGATTAPILANAAAKRQIEMPIAAAVADLVAGRTTVAAVVTRLLARPRRAE